MTFTEAAIPIFGSSPARVLKQLLTLPMLAFIPIHPTSFTVKRTAEVSTQLLISQTLQGKQFVTDNIAPGPRIWTFEGYIKGIPYLELSSWFMPSLTAQKLVLDRAHLSRLPVLFRTDEGEIVQVFIRSLTFNKTPDTMNALQVSADVQEINYLNIVTNAANVTATEKAFTLSVPELGTAQGVGLLIGALLATNFITIGPLELEALLADKQNPNGVSTVSSDLQYLKFLPAYKLTKPFTVEKFVITTADTTSENIIFTVTTKKRILKFSLSFVKRSGEKKPATWGGTVEDTKITETAKNLIIIPNTLLLPEDTKYSLIFESASNTVALDGLPKLNGFIIEWAV
jgi:hypothetical protein